MEIALSSDIPGGFKHRNAIATQNGLALLASITLKNALNINSNSSNNNNSNIKNKNNIKNNHSNLNQNKNNINYHKASQAQYGSMSLQTTSSSSLLSTAESKVNPLSSPLSSLSASNATAVQMVHLPEQRNVFTFTSAGLQSLTATDLSTIETQTKAIAVDPQKQQQEAQQNNHKVQMLKTTLAVKASAGALSCNNHINKPHHTSLSTNHQSTSNTTTSSAKDPSVALLEALSVTPKKKQQTNAKQQPQITAGTPAVTTTVHLSAGAGAGSGSGSGNNNINNNNGNGNGNGSGSSNKNSFRIPSDILDDLASRFIINVPDMELSNLIRICFQIELAHWFYLDFFCASEEEKKLQPCGIKQFALQLFQHIPFLRQHLSSIDKILEDWKNYKLSVPTYGAILISEDLNYCLLVQSYFAKSSWGFPKGKINENEDPVHCAAREVYEETGYDITELIVPNDYIEAVINYQYTRLYIVRDVSLDTKFSPRTRNEIKCCDWFPIDSLPVNKTDAISKPKLGINANSFFMIMPFVKRLKKWVIDIRNTVDTRRKYSSGGSPFSTSPLTTSTVANGQMKYSCKKQQKRNNTNNLNDDINALKNVSGGAATPTTTLCNTIGNSSNSNRSKRQRHKSMGDLDGVKLNNFNNSTNQSNNCKTTVNNNNNNSNCGSATKPAGTTPANICGNIIVDNTSTNAKNTNSNQKRHSKIIAAGCNGSNTNCCTNNNSNNNTVNNNGYNSSSKRQLFHSQSQTNNLQQSGEKIVSSFDLIRKEKQQLKAAAAMAQKQQQNLSSNSGRQRAKSQSDKLCLQLQQQKASANGCNGKQQRIQKQQSLIVNNSNVQNYNINNTNSNQTHNNNNNNINKKSNVNNSVNNKVTTRGYLTPTPPPISGTDLLAVASAAATATSIAFTATTAAEASNKGICGAEQQQKARSTSVSLHLSQVSDVTTANGNQMPQFQRMPSATNLRILKRSTSHQSTSQQHPQPQPPQRQASALQFTPSFNSWTNFTFTKNFIANVFC